MTTASTHTGICQACGRRQAVHINTGNIAKHGYTTDYGFFNGTCGGSDELPLELDTAVNIATVAGMVAYAAKLDARADAEITEVLVEFGPSRWVGNRRTRDSKMMGREEFAATLPAYANFDRKVEEVRFNLRRDARMTRLAASDIDALRDTVHGQPLQERKVEASIKREFYKTYRDAYNRVEDLKAAGHKAQQRRGGGQFTVTYR